MKVLIWLCIISSNAAFAAIQAPEDSLRALMSKSKKARQLWDFQNYTAQLAWTFIRNGQSDSAKKYYQLNLVQEPRGDASFQGNVLLALGTIYHSKTALDSAIYFYRASIVQLKQANDSTNLIVATSNLSVAFKNAGLYEEALSTALETLSLIENEPPSIALGSCYNSIGSIFMYIGNYTDAEVYYRKGLAVRTKIDQPIEVARSYNNLGELFILLKQYDSAIHNLQRAAKIKREISDRKGLAITLSNLGRVSLRIGNTALAQTQLTESLHTQKQINDPVGMIETLNNLGELYLLTNQPEQSAIALADARNLIDTYGTPEYLRQNLELRIRLARERNDFATGMTLLEELAIVRDSLLNEEKSKSLQAMQIRYETQKKEQEIAFLEEREEINQARIQSNRLLIGALVVGLILSAAVGLLIYINLKNARAAKEKFELLLSESRHRMKNYLQTLASIFHLQTRHYTDQDMVLEARNSESRVHTMSLLHERFYSGDADHVVGTHDYITDLVHKLVDIYGAHTPNLKLSLDIDDVDLDIDKALALSLIIQELVCNAFKYAFDHEPNPELSIHLQAHDDLVVTIIHDNGIGLAGSRTSTSHGLNLVDALVSQLDGNLETDNHDGTTFIITFPAISQWKRRVFS